MHALRQALAALQLKLDVVVQQGVGAWLQRQPAFGQQGGERVGLQPEALRWADLRHRVAHMGRHQLRAADVVDEMLHQRLVGAVKARLHAHGRQPLLGRAALGLALEQPALDMPAAPLRL